MAICPCNCKYHRSIDIKTPRMVQLSAFYKRSFAFRSVRERFPQIVKRIMEDLMNRRSKFADQYGPPVINELKQIVEALNQLKFELQSNKEMSSINSDDLDARIFNEQLERVKVETGFAHPFNSPVLFTEAYLYYRMWTIFKDRKILTKYDYFGKIKDDAYDLAQPLMKELARHLTRACECITNKDVLVDMLKIALWANKLDLSVNVAGVEHGTRLNTIRKWYPNIICDQSTDIWNALQTSGTSGTIAYVLAHAGFELFADLCLLDMLITKSFAKDIMLYVKTIPCYVSAATRNDVVDMIKTLERHYDPNMKILGKRWTDYMFNGTWKLEDSIFWHLPLPLSEMKKYDPQLYEKLKASKLLFLKGDLPYRKFLKDTNWNSTVPLDVAAREFAPTKLCMLRVIKYGVICGIQKDVKDKCNRNNENWKESGNHGIIQFTDAKEKEEEPMPEKPIIDTSFLGGSDQSENKEEGEPKGNEETAEKPAENQQETQAAVNQPPEEEKPPAQAEDAPSPSDECDKEGKHKKCIFACICSKTSAILTKMKDSLAPLNPRRSDETSGSKPNDKPSNAAGTKVETPKQSGYEEAKKIPGPAKNQTLKSNVSPGRSKTPITAASKVRGGGSEPTKAEHTIEPSKPNQPSKPNVSKNPDLQSSKKEGSKTEPPKRAASAGSKSKPTRERGGGYQLPKNIPVSQTKTKMKDQPSNISQALDQWSKHNALNSAGFGFKSSSKELPRIPSPLGLKAKSKPTRERGGYQEFSAYKIKTHITVDPSNATLALNESNKLGLLKPLVTQDNEVKLDKDDNFSVRDSYVMKSYIGEILEESIADEESGKVGKNESERSIKIPKEEDLSLKHKLDTKRSYLLKLEDGSVPSVVDEKIEKTTSRSSMKRPKQVLDDDHFVDTDKIQDSKYKLEPKRSDTLKWQNEVTPKDSTADEKIGRLGETTSRSSMKKPKPGLDDGHSVDAEDKLSGAEVKFDLPNDLSVDEETDDHQVLTNKPRDSKYKLDAKRSDPSKWQNEITPRGSTADETIGKVGTTPSRSSMKKPKRGLDDSHSVDTDKLSEREVKFYLPEDLSVDEEAETTGKSLEDDHPVIADKLREPKDRSDLEESADMSIPRGLPAEETEHVGRTASQQSIKKPKQEGQGISSDPVLKGDEPRESKEKLDAIGSNIQKSNIPIMPEDLVADEENVASRQSIQTAKSLGKDVDDVYRVATEDKLREPQDSYVDDEKVGKTASQRSIKKPKQDVTGLATVFPTDVRESKHIPKSEQENIPTGLVLDEEAEKVGKTASQKSVKTPKYIGKTLDDDHSVVTERKDEWDTGKLPEDANVDEEKVRKTTSQRSIKKPQRDDYYPVATVLDGEPKDVLRAKGSYLPKSDIGSQHLKESGIDEETPSQRSIKKPKQDDHPDQLQEAKESHITNLDIGKLPKDKDEAKVGKTTSQRSIKKPYVETNLKDDQPVVTEDEFRRPKDKLEAKGSQIPKLDSGKLHEDLDADDGKVGRTTSQRSIKKPEEVDRSLEDHLDKKGSRVGNVDEGRVRETTSQRSIKRPEPLGAGSGFLHDHAVVGEKEIQAPTNQLDEKGSHIPKLDIGQILKDSHVDESEVGKTASQRSIKKPKQEKDSLKDVHPVATDKLREQKDTLDVKESKEKLDSDVDEVGKTASQRSTHKPKQEGSGIADDQVVTENEIPEPKSKLDTRGSHVSKLDVGKLPNDLDVDERKVGKSKSQQSIKKPKEIERPVAATDQLREPKLEVGTKESQMPKLDIGSRPTDSDVGETTSQRSIKKLATDELREPKINVDAKESHVSKLDSGPKDSDVDVRKTTSKKPKEADYPVVATVLDRLREPQVKESIQQLNIGGHLNDPQVDEEQLRKTTSQRSIDKPRNVGKVLGDDHPVVAEKLREPRDKIDVKESGITKFDRESIPEISAAEKEKETVGKTISRPSIKKLKQIEEASDDTRPIATEKLREPRDMLEGKESNVPKQDGEYISKNLPLGKEAGKPKTVESESVITKELQKPKEKLDAEGSGILKGEREVEKKPTIKESKPGEFQHEEATDTPKPKTIKFAKSSEVYKKSEKLLKSTSQTPVQKQEKFPKTKEVDEDSSTSSDVLEIFLPDEEFSYVVDDDLSITKPRKGDVEATGRKIAIPSDESVKEPTSSSHQGSENSKPSRDRKTKKADSVDKPSRFLSKKISIKINKDRESRAIRYPSEISIHQSPNVDDPENYD